MSKQRHGNNHLHKCHAHISDKDYDRRSNVNAIEEELEEYFEKMAKYDYKCTVCGNVHEEEHGMNESPEVYCEECNNLCEKTFITPPPVQFKGQGWTPRKRS